VVNAATDPQSKRDEKASVPGLVNVLTASATVPLNNYSFDTVNRISTAVEEYNKGAEIRKSCKKILKDVCPEADLPGGDLYEVDVYLSQVAFDFIENPETRFWFKNLSTNFSLPSKTVDSLKKMGQELLLSDEQFKRLISGLLK